MTCEKCGHEMEVGDFPFCRGERSDHVKQAGGVNGDECDFIQENGLKHPRRFRSKQEFKRWLDANSYENKVCNAGPHDKIVARMVTMDAYTMWAAEQLATRNGGSKGKDVASDPTGGLQVSWEVKEWAPT